MTEDPRVASALERNDRYVREFVEAFNLCPYAKRTRETGRLHRVVLLEDYDAALDALVHAIEQLEVLPPESVDVALMIFPSLPQGGDAAPAFEKLVAAARERMQSRHPGSDSPFYCVAFHPDFAEDLGDAHRAVRFIRRSPDPTVQFVRASVLRAVRGSGTTDYVDVSGMNAAELLAVTAPLSVAEKIGNANLRTLQAEGAPRLRALLGEIRAHSRS